MERRGVEAPGGSAGARVRGPRTCIPVPVAVRMGLGLLGGLLWWWAVARWALAPRGRAGLLEGALAFGGWGLGLLPVHCVGLAEAPGVSAARRRGEGLLTGAWAGLTRAWRRRRSDAGSARS